MSVKILKFDRGITHIYLAAVAIVCIASAWFFVKWNFANVVASALDTERPESKIVVESLVEMAPDDPQTHFIAARLFEKTFDDADLAKSLTEYETATALSPNNYLLWLELGKARDSGGDRPSAGAAFHRALELAPNYSAVQWAYGNSLIRQGNSDHGFALIAKAAASDPQYSNPAVAIALQLFDGNVGQVRSVLGDSAEANAALASVLAAGNRFDDAFDAWSQLAADDKRTKFKQIGGKLVEQLITAKKFQLASRVTGDLLSDDSEKTVLGQISNGGFENGVKLRNAGIFEWQIAEGAEPQIGLSEGQPHSGKYSLLMAFNTFNTVAFRPVSQTVPVVPGASYEFEVFYKSDLKSTAAFKWEIADASTGTAITTTAPMMPVVDWVPMKAKFTVPAVTDAIIIRFVREGCAGTCSVNGKLSFDDLSISRL